MNVARPALTRQSMKETFTGVATVQFFFLIVFTFMEVTGRWTDAYLPMMAALAGTIFGRERIRLPAPFWWGVGLLAWILLDSFFSMSQAYSLAVLYDRVKVMLIFLVVMNAIRTEKQLWVYLLVILVAFMIYPGRGTVLNYMHHDLTEGRASWNYIYSNPNDLAAISLLILGATLAIATAATQSRTIRWSAAVCAAILVFVVFVTESRAGFLGLVIGIGPPLLLRSLKRPAVFVYALVALSVGLAILPDSLWVRLYGLRDLTSTSTLSEANDYGSAEERWEIQQTAWKISTEHPLFGVGLGCYPFANNQYRPDLGRRDTHDTYLNLTAELGVPGLLLWFAIIISALRHFQRVERNKLRIPTVEPIWLKYGFIGFLIAGVFGTYSGNTITYLVLGILWSAAELPGAEPKPPVRASARAKAPRMPALHKSP